MPWGFAAAAVGTIASSVIGGSAANDAANTQANASTEAAQIQADSAAKASQTQLDMFNQTQANEQPFLQAGQNALPFLQAGIGLGPGGTGVGPLNAPYTGPMPTQNPAMAPFTADMFHNSPGYQFQLQQGQDSVLNNASRLGGVNSGNTLKALTQFGQGTANQDYWNAYNAYVNNYQTNATNTTNNNAVAQTNYGNFTGNQLTQFNELQTLAGSGQNAAGNLGSLGANVGQSIGNNIIGAGNAGASGIIGAGNASAAGRVGSATAIGNGISGIGNNYLLYNLLNQGNAGGGGFGGTQSYDPSNVDLFGGG